MGDLVTALRRLLGWESPADDSPRGPSRPTTGPAAQDPPARIQPLVEVAASQLAKDPGAVWAGVCSKLLAIPCLEHLRLSPTQRNAWLVLTYGTTVRREGHGRFFRVYGVGRAGEVVVALTEVEALSAAEILDEAIPRDFSYLDDNETAVGAAGFPSMRLGRPPEYFDLDVLYLGIADNVRQSLERYMATHCQDFISIGEAAQGDDADEAR